MTDVIYSTADVYYKTGYEQGKADALKVIENIKAEFTSCYPKNVYGELELGGRSCVFSLNQIFEILDKHIGGRSESVETDN